MPYICPPSALGILESCGIDSNYVQTILPGQSLQLKKQSIVLEIIATTGALLGPPWQQPENGYIIRSSDGASLYYEPHCMFDVAELSKFSVDFVVTPITSQELPAFTLVAGGRKALDLAKTLKAKTVIPLANGELDQSGILASIIDSVGTVQDFKSMAGRENIKVLDIEAGVSYKLS